MLQKPFLSVYTATAFSQNKTAPEETSTTGYILTDLTIGGNLKVKSQFISVSLGASNLFDTKYIDHLSTLKVVGYFNPGRNIA